MGKPELKATPQKKSLAGTALTKGVKVLETEPVLRDHDAVRGHQVARRVVAAAEDEGHELDLKRRKEPGGGVREDGGADGGR